MGQISDLQAKLADGSITEAEKAELETLKKEAAEISNKEAEIKSAEDTKVEDLAEAIAAKAFGKLSEKLDAEVKAEAHVPVMADVKMSSDKFVMDKPLGQVSVDKLAEIKHVIPERKSAGKQYTEITGKTIHFMSALMHGDKEKLQVLVEGTDSLGGYLVPAEFQNMIVEDLRDATVMRQIANTITTTSNELHLPKLDTRPQAQWRNEAAVKATSTAQFSELVFTPYSLASIVPLSQELSDDATLGVNGSIINYIAGLMTQSLAEKEDLAFWTGNGTGQPTGISQYTVGSRAKSANMADDVIELFHDLKQGYRGRAVWVGNARTLATVRQLKDTQNRYLVQNLGDSPYGSLLGRPMYEQNNLSNELYLGDFSYYQIVDRQGISVRVSDEATVAGSSAFEKNLVFVRVEKRVDAELTLTEAVKKITGV